MDWPFQRDLLWGETAALVRQEPEAYLAVADLLTPDDFPGAWPYFKAYEDLSRDRTSFDWRPLIRSCFRLTREGDSKEAHWSISHLLRTAAWDRHNQVPRRDLGRIKSVASKILGAEATRVDEIAVIENSLPDHQLKFRSRCER